jgi:hypothetical protein
MRYHKNIPTLTLNEFRIFFPKLHTFLSNLGCEIVEVDNPRIEQAFPGCCYPACHFNLNKSCALRHADFFNLLFFMCTVVANGPFDHTRGGHFIAWNLGLVFEFRSSSTIYVPSAFVDHSNTSIAPHERRHSMAFFVPAGLAQWYHNGFTSDHNFQANAKPEQLQEWDQY